MLYDHGFFQREVFLFPEKKEKKVQKVMHQLKKVMAILKRTRIGSYLLTSERPYWTISKSSRMRSYSKCSSRKVRTIRIMLLRPFFQ